MSVCDSFCFKTPCSIMVVGQSGSGKTCLVERILYHLPRLTDKPLHHIHYVYGANQAKFKDMKERLKSKITFSTQLPDGPEDLLEIFKGKPGLLVIDDYQNEAVDDPRVANLFTKHSHHCDVTCIFIGQSIFPKGKYARTMSTNSHYYMCFYNPRDEVSIKTLLQQAFAENYRYAIDSFRDATAEPLKYMLLDLHPKTPRDQRIKANVLPDEGFTVVYKPGEQASN